MSGKRCELTVDSKMLSVQQLQELAKSVSSLRRRFKMVTWHSKTKHSPENIFVDLNTKAQKIHLTWRVEVGYLMDTLMKSS